MSTSNEIPERKKRLFNKVRMFKVGRVVPTGRPLFPSPSSLQPRTPQPNKVDVFSLKTLSLFSASFKQSSFKLALALCRKRFDYNRFGSVWNSCYRVANTLSASRGIGHPLLFDQLSVS